MRRLLRDCELLRPDVVTHPVRERCEALVGLHALLLRCFTKRHHESDHDAGRVRTDHLQRRLEITVVRADNLLLALRAHGVAIDVQGQVHVGLLFFDHPDLVQVGLVWRLSWDIAGRG